jgi:hypothetical protein
MKKIKNLFITPICIQVHFVFHSILSEIGDKFTMVKVGNPLVNGDQLLLKVNSLLTN